MIKASIPTPNGWRLRQAGEPVLDDDMWEFCGAWERVSGYVKTVTDGVYITKVIPAKEITTPVSNKLLLLISGL